MEDASGERNDSDLYEEVLEHARREIESSASQVEELRRALGMLEARVEAAKAVYEAAAARLNLQDESDGQGVSETLSSVQTLLTDDESAGLRSRPRKHTRAGSATGQQGGGEVDAPESWRRLRIGGSTLVWKRVKKPGRRQRGSGGSGS